MENRPELRIGDPERGTAFDRLTELFTNGYLDVAEFDDRTALVARATHQSDLAAVFSDLPHVPGSASIGTSDADPRNDADVELEKVLERGRKVQAVDMIIWPVATALFFLGLFVMDWDYFWAFFPIAGLISIASRAAFGLDDGDEEIFEELDEQERKKRAQRLRLAAQRRKELGQ